MCPYSHSPPRQSPLARPRPSRTDLEVVEAVQRTRLAVSSRPSIVQFHHLSEPGQLQWKSMKGLRNLL